MIINTSFSYLFLDIKLYNYHIYFSKNYYYIITIEILNIKCSISKGSIPQRSAPDIGTTGFDFDLREIYCIEVPAGYLFKYYLVFLINSKPLARKATEAESK